MKNTLLLPLLLIAILATSCTSYTYGVGSYAVYKQGYWGNWKETSYSSIPSSLTIDSESFTIYHRGSHPSNYNLKIMPVLTSVKTTKNNNGTWYNYKGIVAYNVIAQGPSNIEDWSRYAKGDLGTSTAVSNVSIRIKGRPFSKLHTSGAVINIFFDNSDFAIAFSGGTSF